MDERAMIERRLQSEGWTAKEWREDDLDGLLAVVGRAQVLEDNEDVGLYEGDEGELALSVVGAEKYGNQHVHVGFMAEGYDSYVEVRDATAVELL